MSPRSNLFQVLPGILSSPSLPCTHPAELLKAPVKKGHSGPARININPQSVRTLRAYDIHKRMWNPWHRTNPCSSVVFLAISKFRILGLERNKWPRRCPFTCVLPNRFWALTIGQAFKGHGEGHKWVRSGLLPGGFHSTCELEKGPLMAKVISCCLKSFLCVDAWVSHTWASGKAWLVYHWDLVSSTPRCQLRAVITQIADRSILNQEYCFLTHLVSPFYLTLIPRMKGGTHVELSFHRCPWCPRGGCPMSGTNKRLEWFLPLLLQMTHTCLVHWLLKVLESNICYIHGHKSLCLA